jgi:hypothetical protein
LGCELKSACDACTGIKLFIEMQKGKVKDARKEFRRTCPAATACTLRLLKGAGCCEKDRTQRCCIIDSWFENMTTVEAVRKEMGCCVAGCIKTGHARFPIQAMRWTLAEMERGDHMVMEHEDEEGNKTWAMEWSDVHCKALVTTHGSADDGEPASKKRQRADGRDCQIEVKRPSGHTHLAPN